ncbi:hypothetical protein HR45_13640 [Shewanella mangrovi]|uniref:Uncharacterized protein n=1 Tax=Shewanella mangrovi TaxID=1515746 RepID=A0A094LP07_9GAMM|nr:hypothetical protein [Shewanella mangrovi]KFZ36843.1 hypothetical protein HR45_13640 [Shewanella mangrovi]
MAEQNFCLKRIEHLIEVKSHLIEAGIAGFSRLPRGKITDGINTPSIKDNAMTTEFSSVNLAGFIPSHSLRKTVDGGDISAIRAALFMELNDKRLSTAVLRQTIAWTIAQHPNLFVAYEENAYAQSMVTDTSKWDTQYYGIQEVYASSNFSHERISHIIAVRERVFGIQESNARYSTNSTSIPTNKSLAKTPVPGRAPLENNQTVSTTSRNNPIPKTKHPDSEPLGDKQNISTKSRSNILNSLLLIGGALLAVALVILAVIDVISERNI